MWLSNYVPFLWLFMSFAVTLTVHVSCHSRQHCRSRQQDRTKLNYQIKTNFGYPIWKWHNQNHVNPGLITLCDCRITYLFCGCLCLLLSLWRSMFPAIVGNIAGADNKIGLNFVPAYFQSLTQWYEHTFVICRKSCL